MATIDQAASHKDLAERLKAMRDEQLTAQELVQQGAIHVLSTLLETDCTKQAITEMLASLRKCDEVLHQEIERREMCALFGLDQQPVDGQAEQEPIDMVLHCPKCGMQHLDVPEEGPRILYADEPISAQSYGTLPGWDNPPHRSHLCHGCNHIWRPADVPTNGVQAIKTKGKADSAAPAQAAEPVPEVQRTAPERIYLNIYEADDSDRPFPKSCSDDEVTWSKEATLECAVPYVRADLAAQAAPKQSEGAHWAAVTEANKRWAPLAKAVVSLLAAVDERHDQPEPLKYTIPYGAVNALREAVGIVGEALRSPMETKGASSC